MPEALREAPPIAKIAAVRSNVGSQQSIRSFTRCSQYLKIAARRERVGLGQPSARNRHSSPSFTKVESTRNKNGQFRKSHNHQPLTITSFGTPGRIRTYDLLLRRKQSDPYLLPRFQELSDFEVSSIRTFGGMIIGSGLNESVEAAWSARAAARRVDSVAGEDVLEDQQI
jgi:hypothetical protein